jgi:hypothetical protein
MELKDFIKSAISSISQAIVEAQDELKDTGVIVNPEYTIIKNDGKSIDSSGSRYVEELSFEVHVGIDESTSGVVKGSAGLKVILTAEGSLETKSSSSNANVLKFKIPVAFPYSPIPEGFKRPVLVYDTPKSVPIKARNSNIG